MVLDKMLSFVKGLPSAVYMAIGAVALLGVAYGGGYLVGSRNEARIQIEKVYVPVKEIQQVQVRNIERERQLEETIRTQRISQAALRGQLDRLADDNRTLNADAVRLLNEAIANGAATDPTGVPAGEATTVTDFTNWAFDATVRYNDVSTRYNALIDWVEEELIEPERNTDK